MSGGIGGVPTHVHMHTHAPTHMYTCIEIANDCPHGGIHVYHVYNMHAHACVCVCVHMSVHAWDTPTPIPTPTLIHPPNTPQGDP